MSIHGASDELVPYDQGEQQIEAIKRQITEGKQGGVMEIWLKEGAGHVVTTDMVEKTAEWVWRHALSQSPRSHV